MASSSIVGLGKLGASAAAAIAGRGGRVVGVDVDRARVNRVNAGQAPVFEMGLAEQIAANRERLRATTDYREAILERTSSAGRGRTSCRSARTHPRIEADGRRDDVRRGLRGHPTGSTAAAAHEGRSALVVLDCWRLLSDKLSNHSGVRYLAIGRGPVDAGEGARLASLSAAALER